MATVCIYVYDLSMGMARVMSVSLVGKQVDIVPHTGVVVEWPSGAKEYFFGGGVCVTPAGQAMGMPTCEIIQLGRTTKSMAEVDAFLRELSPRFTADTYNLLSHNCNHFSNELAHFLTGGTGGVPARIVNVADEALSAPQGQQLRMMLESMQANMAAAQLGNRFNPLAHVSDVEVRRACLTTVAKLGSNLVEHPTELTKYGKIKAANPAFAKKVAGAAAYADSFAKVTVQAANALLDGAAVLLTPAAAMEKVMTVAPAKVGAHNEAAVPAPRQRTAADSVALLPAPTKMRVLDVATGTGLIAAAAAERGASEVVGVDMSQAMLDLCAPVAKAHPGVVTFVLGDAEQLPLPDASFDAVILGFVLLHLPEPAKALSEAFRVLKPGGKVAYSVWEPPERGNAAFQMLLGAISAHGDASKALPGAPLPFFHFAERAHAATALTTAGFSADSVRVETIPAVVPLAHKDDLFEMFHTATARTRALLEMQSPAQLAAIRAAVGHAVEARYAGVPYQGAQRSTSWLRAVVGTDDAPLLDGRPSGRRDGRAPFQVPAPCVVASAMKPL